MFHGCCICVLLLLLLCFFFISSRSNACVCAWQVGVISGHHHEGAFGIDAAGIAHFTIASPLTHHPQGAFAVVGAASSAGQSVLSGAPVR